MPCFSLITSVGLSVTMGLDGVREPGARRVRHGRWLCRRHVDAYVRRRLRTIPRHCCGCRRRGERRVRTRSLPPALQVDRPRTGFADDWSGVHGDRHCHISLWPDPEIGALAGVVARRRQSRLSLLPELSRIFDRPRGGAYRGSLVRVRAYKYRGQDPCRSR